MNDSLTRRDFLKLLAAGTLFSSLECYTENQSSSKRRPNILFLLADDHRWDKMEPMGNTVVHTPNMKKLGADGVIFDNTFVTSPLCMASRASIFTGKYESRHECNFRRQTLSRENFRLSYSSLLKEAGYRTGFIGKFGFAVTENTENEKMEGDPEQYWHQKKYMPEKEFDEWFGFAGQGYYDKKRILNGYPEYEKYFRNGEHLTQAMGNMAIDFLQKSDNEQPFCLSISFKAPHTPYQPDSRFSNLYEEKTRPYPVNYSEHYFKALPNIIKESKARTFWWQNYWSPEYYEENSDKYYQLISGIDDAIGRIRNELERLDLADNTIIIYSSDNGYFCGSKGLGGKVLLYEESIRVPLIIYDPRIDRKKTRKRASEMALNIDIAPTICSMANVPIPKEMQGKDISPLLKTKDDTWRDVVFTENFFPGHGPRCKSVRTKKWKYIRYYEESPVIEELFDLEMDPIEHVNQVNNPNYSQVLSTLRKTCDEWILKAQ